ncbi:MAG: hypothetical protein ACRC8F_04050 [Cetobacterium sp.]
MARKQSLFSAAIDFVMSHSSFYMRFQENLEFQARVDIKDDIRRKNIRTKERIFFKKMDVAIREKDLKKIEDLLREFKITKEKDYILEDRLEALDDEARNTNITSTDDALERAKRETHTYQMISIENHVEVI